MLSSESSGHCINVSVLIKFSPFLLYVSANLGSILYGDVSVMGYRTH